MRVLAITLALLLFSASSYGRLNPQDDPGLKNGQLGELHGKTVKIISTNGNVPGVKSGICDKPDGCDEEVVQASLGGGEEAFIKPQTPSGSGSSDQSGSGSTDK